MDEAKGLLSDLTFCDDPFDALDGADALAILTEWDQFRALDLERVKSTLKTPLIVDLRNIYDPKTMQERGFTYHGIGS